MRSKLLSWSASERFVIGVWLEPSQFALDEKSAILDQAGYSHPQCHVRYDLFALGSLDKLHEDDAAYKVSNNCNKSAVQHSGEAGGVQTTSKIYEASVADEPSAYPNLCIRLLHIRYVSRIDY